MSTSAPHDTLDHIGWRDASDKAWRVYIRTSLMFASGIKSSDYLSLCDSHYQDAYYNALEETGIDETYEDGVVRIALTQEIVDAFTRWVKRTYQDHNEAIFWSRT